MSNDPKSNGLKDGPSDLRPPGTWVREVIDHHGETIVRAAYQGEFDKTNLPQEVILTDYFRVLSGKIVSLTIIFNQPSPY